MLWTLLVASVMFAAGLQLPADVAISGGRAMNGICASCCQADAYCGKLSEDVDIYSSDGTSLTVRKGSSMTCLLRDRSMPSQVDGGLCVPSSLPADFGIPDMCRRHDKTLSVSHTLSQVVYQSGLVTQEECGACYDGYHSCAAGLTCRSLANTSTPGLPYAVCVPNDTTETACGQRINMQNDLRHESCDKPTPAAELFEQQHSLPFRRRLQTASPLVDTSSRKLLQAEKTEHLLLPKATTRWTPNALAPTGAHNGMCQANANGCVCPQYQTCAQGRCVQMPGYCENKQRCPAEHGCKDHYCVNKCNSHKRCEAGHSTDGHIIEYDCQEHFCIQKCDSNTPCKDGYGCKNNFCELKCDSCSPCKVGYQCTPYGEGLQRHNYCVKQCDNLTKHCKAGFECKEKLCVPAPATQKSAAKQKQ